MDAAADRPRDLPGGSVGVATSSGASVWALSVRVCVCVSPKVLKGGMC